MDTIEETQDVRSTSVGRLMVVQMKFFALALPLSVTFVVVGSVLGVLNVVTLPFRENAKASFREPWAQVWSVLRVIGKHFRYLYRCEWLPRRREQLAAALKKQREKLAAAKAKRTARERYEAQRAMLRSSDFDVIDAEFAVLLTGQMLPFLVILPHLVFCFIGMVSVMGYTVYYDGTVKKGTAPIVAPVAEYEMQVVDRQERDFGPWYKRGEIRAEADQIGFRNIALLNDAGTLRYSRRFTVPKDGFTPAVTHKVYGARVRSDGRIDFKDQHRNGYTLNPWQAFLFENHKTSVFMFDADGRILSSPTDTVVPKATNTEEIK